VLPIVNFNTLKKSIAEDISRDIIKTNSNAPKPIIIIGSKGAGKTTFINHLFKYKFKTSEIPNHYIVYIDFRSFFESESIFEPSRLAKEILNNIQLTYGELKLHTIDILKRVYIHEIKKKNEGTWNNVKEHDPNEYQKKLSDFLDESQSNYLYHLEMVAAYLIWERQKRLIIIIDNADQFEQEIQKKIFLFSSTLNKKMQCGTVISLREGYYYQWRLTPPFDAFISNVYHITAPKYSEVLEKRIDYAIENLTLENENKIHSTHIVDSEDVITQMIDFLSAIKKSLFTESNTEILDYLFYTTYPNIREGLKIFKIFLTSMHTKIQVYVRNERIKAEVKNNSSVIPFHEFLKSIGLQNTHYYSSGRSIIHNILTPPPGSTDHLINVYLLKFLDKVDSSNSSDKFTSLSQIYNLFSSFGY
jgi:GTPase SAR1 family protein